ncbi:MAG: excalibur calcium-binding domain-containing protein [Meiothermus sp.]|nr:excalibur calcium-binding domain-containing protein [Meiothermus sp.]
MKRLNPLAVTVLAALVLLAVLPRTNAQTATKYSNCAALTQDYPYGVGISGAKDKTSSSRRPVTDFEVSAGVYSANSHLDRDDDNIACEEPYPNCPSLNQDYPNGVGLPGARDKVSGNQQPVTTFRVSAVTYQLNTHLDRDDDNIACERH